MESMEWYGTVHMDSMDYHGLFHGFHMEWYGTVHMESMEWYGIVHMDSMDWSMESIWNGDFIVKNYQVLHEFHEPFHVDSMHHSIWNSHLRVVKINIIYIYIHV
jgi:hypothetical protein